MAAKALFALDVSRVDWNRLASWVGQPAITSRWHPSWSQHVRFNLIGCIVEGHPFNDQYNHERIVCHWFGWAPVGPIESKYVVDVRLVTMFIWQSACDSYSMMQRFHFQNQMANEIEKKSWENLSLSIDRLHSNGHRKSVGAWHEKPLHRAAAFCRVQHTVCLLPFPFHMSHSLFAYAFCVASPCHLHAARTRRNHPHIFLSQTRTAQSRRAGGAIG